MKIDSRGRLKGIAVNLEETGETRTDDGGDRLAQMHLHCGASRLLLKNSWRTAKRTVDAEAGEVGSLVLSGPASKAELVKTLGPDETEAVLKGEKIDTVFW